MSQTKFLKASDKFFAEVMAIHGDDAADARTVEAMREALLKAKAKQATPLTMITIELTDAEIDMLTLMASRALEDPDFHNDPVANKVAKLLDETGAVNFESLDWE